MSNSGMTFDENNSGFLIEDFIDAITSQLDQVQDALRIKALNRPLTYALKDFSMELKMFVVMDQEGQVRFRPSNPNEPSASTIHLDFTTITKPMIEENTVSLEVTRSPSLAEIGLSQEEQKRLKRYGVRNAAELKKLGKSTGAKAISRFSGIPISRLRRAFQQSRPEVSNVEPVRPSQNRETKSVSAKRPTKVKGRTGVRPDFKIDSSLPVIEKILPKNIQKIKEQDKNRAAIRITPEINRLRLSGRNLVGNLGQPKIFLNKKPLSLTLAEEDQLEFDLLEQPDSGILELVWADGEKIDYDLVVEEDENDENNLNFELDQATDPWGVNLKEF